MNTMGFPEINLDVKPLDNCHSAVAAYRPRFIVATMAYLTKSEKCVCRARHSDSTMAKSDGLMRKPLISVFLHLFSFNVVLSYAWFLPIDWSAVFDIYRVFGRVFDTMARSILNSGGVAVRFQSVACSESHGARRQS
jgi:hypothetical protein